MILFIINTLRLVSPLYERKSDQRMHRAVQYQSTTQHVHWKQIVFQNLPIYLLASLPKVLQSSLIEVPDAHLQVGKSFISNGQNVNPDYCLFPSQHLIGKISYTHMSFEARSVQTPAWDRVRSKESTSCHY